MNLKKITLREKIMLIALVVVGGGYFLFDYFFLPQWDQYQQLSTETPQLKADVTELKAKVRRVQKLENELKVLTQEAGGQTGIDEAQSGAVLLKLGQEGRNNGILLNRFYPQETINHNGYLELPIEMAVQGSYQNIVKFLAAVEGAYPQAVVSKMYLSPVLRPDEGVWAIGGTPADGTQPASPGTTGNPLDQNGALKPKLFPWLEEGTGSTAYNRSVKLPASKAIAAPGTLTSRLQANFVLSFYRVDIPPKQTPIDPDLLDEYGKEDPVTPEINGFNILQFLGIAPSSEGVSP